MNEKIVCVGMTMADVVVCPVPEEGLFAKDTVRVDEVNILPGGDATNQSIALAKLGKHPVLMAGIGVDNVGGLVMDILRARGVDLSGVVRLPGLGTTVSVALINEKAERVFLLRSTGNNSITLDKLDLSVLEGAAAVCVGSLWGMPGMDGEGIVRLLDHARELGAITVADATDDQSHIGPESVKEAVRHVDYFTPSMWEATALTGLNDPASAAKALLELGPRAVVIKLGEKGCVLASREGGVRRFDAIHIDAIDTTGAGDSFVAGFTAKLSEGAPLEDCVRFGCASGALSTTTVGANSAPLTYEGVEKLALSCRAENPSGIAR